MGFLYELQRLSRVLAMNIVTDQKTRIIIPNPLRESSKTIHQIPVLERFLCLLVPWLSDDSLIL
jgi:hypothetical protein